ncbi:MAG: hypothetical protein IT466_07365 [Moraxellaceae bacterium]|jgi:hypothetical protein|nr:hypothetical protein [Moraxellaceae bacterium]MBP8852210.1 hypothetical protein [Moraxellaceae bacterium]MBP9045802.1 hypothetical protein [Moraxellaceae bacterium]MBP9729946.1 hypothetical protein [Moraxellaceae bacterium]MCC6200573.1 hypothetical protein [Moraxellaceae bacterium]
MRFAIAESVGNMTGRWWALVVLMVPLVAGAQNSALSPKLMEEATSLPWFDMEGRLVLHVERIPDLKALLIIQRLLQERGGVHPIRLIGVSASEAWFVADSLPVDSWQALLATEPRLRLSEPSHDSLREGAKDDPFVQSVIWITPVDSSSDYPANPSTIELH